MKRDEVLAFDDEEVLIVCDDTFNICEHMPLYKWDIHGFAYEVEEKIKQMGYQTQSKYYQLLSDFVCKHTTNDFTPFNLLHVAAVQRCRTALLCICDE